jgi:copper chaperone CopZ
MPAAPSDPVFILAQGGKAMTKRAAFLAAALLFLVSPVVAQQKKSSGSKVPATAQLRLTQCAFKVRGMVCSTCAQGVQERLMKLKGVKSASADYKTGDVQVRYDSRKTSPGKVIQGFSHGTSGFHGELWPSKGK